MKVSLIASSVRPQLYDDFFKSLEGTSVEYEVIFAGNLTPNEFREYELKYPLKYIQTSDIKPAQCYEIARREAKGEVTVWVADDCEFHNDVIGKAYKYWKRKNSAEFWHENKDYEMLILSIQTKESGYNLPEGKLFDMDNHRFFGGQKSTPLMAPLAMISTRFLDSLSGFDKRYICGQYENDVIMNAYMKGGMVEIFGDKDCYIDIDHLGKSIKIGESENQNDFQRRPFATGYKHDREILEGSWSVAGHIRRLDDFEPYEDKDIYIKSQSFKGKWE